MHMMETMYNTNCLDWMRQQSSDIIDLTVTSPPYDNLRDYKGYSFDFEPIAKELFRITKQGGIVVWVVGDGTLNGSETGTSFKQALYFKEQCGFNLHDTMIYEKNTSSFPSGAKSNRYTQIFEYMFVLSKGKPKTSNLIVDKPNKWAGWQTWGVATKRQTDGTMKESGFGEKKIRDFGIRNNMWEILNNEDLGNYIREVFKDNPPDNSNTIERSEIWRIICSGGFGHKDKLAYEHPATFPEKLAEDHILTWSNPGEVVFDPFAGSGTTLLMAHKNNRKYIGCEISKEYFDLIEQRFINLCKKTNENGDIELASKTFDFTDEW